MVNLNEADKRTLDRVHDINLEMLKRVDEICKKHNITYFFCWGALIGSYRYQDFVPWDNDVDLMITREEFKKLIPYLRTELDPELYELVMPEDYGNGKYFDVVPHVIYKKCEIKAFSDEYNEFYSHKANRIALDFFFLDPIPETFGGKITVWRLMFLYGLLNGKRYSKEMSREWPNFILKMAAAVLRFLGKPLNTYKLIAKTERLATKYKDDPKANILRVTNEDLKSFSYHLPKEYFRDTKPVPIRDELFPAPIDAEKVLTVMYGDYMTPPPEEDQVPHIFNRVLTADLFEFTE